jgi:outer membrane lipoprotein-sorting protein
MPLKLATRTLVLSIAAIMGAGACFADALPEILLRMDAAARNFESMTADMKQVTHTEIIDENDTAVGTVRLKQVKNGLLGYVHFTEPPKVIAFQTRKIEVYYPKTKVVEQYDVDKYSDQLNQFLLLGFGTSGKDLQKNYDIQLAGSETVAGKPTTHIVLTPKSKQALEYLKKAELWILDGATYPIQEKLWKNADDYVLVTYSNVKLNVPLSDKEFALNLPPGVQRIRPGK